MMSRGTYLRSTVSFLAWSSQLRWRVLNLDAPPSLSSGRHRWKCSYQYGLSESEYVLIRLIDDFRGPLPSIPLPPPPSPPPSPRSQLINVWVALVFPY